MRAAAVPAHPAFSRYWIDVIFDFQTTEPREAYKRPLLLGAEPSSGVSSSGPTRWALTSYRSEGASLEFVIGSHVPLYAQFDLNECWGEFVISDQDGATIRSFAVETLRASKFPRWHSRSQIDLSAFSGATHIRITPADGKVATDGIIAV